MNLEACSESRIERMKKLLSSPLTKKKSSAHGKMFGTALETLVQRETQQGLVPFIIVRICQYIEKHANVRDQEKCVHMLKCLVGHLPQEHYEVLKYLMHFLYCIAQLEEQNRMSASSLGIVFAPNLFRVSDDFTGLKDQAVTNQITMNFIKNYSTIFEESNSNEITEEQLQFEVKSLPLDEPLSVVIPPVNDQRLGFEGHHNGQVVHKQIPVLMVDSCEIAHTNSNEDNSYTSSTFFNTIATPPGRKRKERKFSGEDAVIRSNSEERPNVNDEIDGVSSSSNTERLRRCSSHEDVRKITDGAVIVVSKPVQTRRKSSAEVIGVNLTVSAGRLVLATQNQELSPHPPKPKRRELENTTASLVAVCVSTPEQSEPPCVLQSSEHDFHELQRSAERLMQHSQPTRSRRTSSKSSRFRKSQSMESDESSKSSDSVVPTENKSKERGSRSSKSSRESSRSRDSSRRSSSSSSETREADRNSNYPLLDLVEQLDVVDRLEGEEDWQNNEMVTSCESDEVIPQLDFSAMHQHGDGNEPLLSEHRFSWPLAKPTQEETALLSPSAPFLRKTNSLQFDPSLPPSPPVEQERVIRSVVKDEAATSQLRPLSKKMSSLKKKVKRFEASFEYQHGFRPSYAEKMNFPEVKKLLLEFNRTRREFKQLKDEISAEGFEVSARGLYPNGFCLHGEGIPTVQESMTVAQNYLSENRKQCQRPESFDEMTGDQIQEEKIAMQKALLQFESVHGRPISRLDRDLARPMYDRYRKVKRLARSSAMGGNSVAGGSGMKGKDLVVIGTELQPILEHEAMDFTSPQHRRMSDENQKVPDISEDIAAEEDQEQEPENPGMEDASNHNTLELQMQSSSNLHELPVHEMSCLLAQLKARKKALKRVIYHYENDFSARIGRKPVKEDRTFPELQYYQEYKHAKARSKLLEALVTKHKQSQ